MPAIPVRSYWSRGIYVCLSVTFHFGHTVIRATTADRITFLGACVTRVGLGIMY